MEDAYFAMGEAAPQVRLTSTATAEEAAASEPIPASIAADGTGTAASAPAAAEGGAPASALDSSAPVAGGVTAGPGAANPSLDPAYDAVRNPMVAAALARADPSPSSAAGGLEPAAAAASSSESSKPPLPAALESGGRGGNDLADDANEEIALLLQSRQISQADVTALQRIVRENATLREKVTKLKSLLGRSARAQRETKAELDVAKVRLEEAHREAERLKSRVESLAARPTHMDLLADFETNFDRALLSIGHGGGAGGEQKGGEDSHPSGGATATAVDDSLLDASAAAAAFDGADGDGEVVSSMLLAELSDAKLRTTKLESLNAALLGRASKLERRAESLARERDDAVAASTNLQLELRMSKMETDAASRAARERESSFAEMQLEIDLVTRSAVAANARAEEGREAAERVGADRAHVGELEAKVGALQEWALASAESKRLVSERCRVLEERLRDLTERDGDGEGALGGGGGLLSLDDSQRAGGCGAGSGTSAAGERRLWTKQATLVVGAGMVGGRVVDLGQVQVGPNEAVVLRWKFDLTPAEVDILFSILKGRWEYNSMVKLREADALFKDRVVRGGGAGEVSGAFAVQGACTLVWNNSKSWVRPKTIKYTVEAYAVM